MRTITLYVGGVPVTPGEPVVYGTVTSVGASYMPVVLVFGNGAWEAISAGQYAMDIYYNSYFN